MISEFARPHAALLIALSIYASLLSGVCQVAYEEVKSFGNPALSGHTPVASLVEDTNGLLYGVTSLGGLHNYGTCFKIDRDGNNHRVLHHFGESVTDGKSPSARLLLASDGFLYGSTSSGGAHNAGTLFKLGTDGDHYSLLHRFDTNGVEGIEPRAHIVEGPDGQLYGTTRSGGIHRRGTVFRVARTGAGFEVLWHFGETLDDGATPLAGLTLSSDGLLYGVTSGGGSNRGGLLFSISPTGADYRPIHHFQSATDGEQPSSELLEGFDGRLYGTTKLGGPYDAGTVFRIDRTGTSFTLLHAFTVAEAGRWPVGGLTQALDGSLHGTTSSGGSATFHGTHFRINPSGSLHRIVHHFTASAAAVRDGSRPLASLLLASDGLLYGTTSSGGIHGFDGTLFRVAPTGDDYRVLHDFSRRGYDGTDPTRVFTANDGYLYGITRDGGGEGLGTFFRLREDGNGYEILDDSSRIASLVPTAPGWLHGTTVHFNQPGTLFRMRLDGTGHQVVHEFAVGHSASAFLFTPDSRLYGGTCCDNGTLFSVALDGTDFQTLHTFGNNSSDGDYPGGGLIEGTDGRLYGITPGGGLHGRGTVFGVGKDGANYAILRHFQSSGANRPLAALVEGSDGALYGTSSEGGRGEVGTLFKLFKDGMGFQILHHFDETNGDGACPRFPLVAGFDGALYGVTDEGGRGSGVLFRVDAGGTGYRILHRFDETTQGFPNSPLVPTGDGWFFGATEEGGVNRLGTVYRFRIPSELTIERVAGGVTLSWPSLLNGYQLQSSATFHSPTWTWVADPVTQQGDVRQVTVEPSGPHRIFRLRSLFAPDP